MQALIEVFRMDEIKHKTRANIIIKLGEFINAEYTMHITEPLVYELVSLLDPKHPQLQNKDFLSKAGVNL